MSKENTSTQRFKKNIKRITKDINAYYQQVPKASFAFLVIHQHLGLVQNIVQVCKYIVGTKISLMIPDLFTTVTSKTLLNNQFDAVKKLQFSRVYDVIISCAQELKKSHKNVVLMGFSIGSAYGIKILEKIGQNKEFQCAFMFYGLPDLKYLQPKKIKTKTVLFHGTQDKIKYLSDPKMYEAFLEKGPDTRNVFKIQQIKGVGHGFLNPQSPEFSEQIIQKCQNIISNYLPKDAIEKIPDKGKNSEQKKQDCRIF